MSTATHVEVDERRADSSVRTKAAETTATEAAMATGLAGEHGAPADGDGEQQLQGALLLFAGGGGGSGGERDADEHEGQHDAEELGVQEARPPVV